MKENVPFGLEKGIREFLELGLEVQQQRLKQQDPVDDGALVVLAHDEKTCCF